MPPSSTRPQFAANDATPNGAQIAPLRERVAAATLAGETVELLADRALH
jgi:hypothetical protein